jgi:hypothetical protein
MIKAFNVLIEVEVNETDISDDRLVDVLEKALKYSTAPEALQEAVAESFGDKVEFLGWQLSK